MAEKKETTAAPEIAATRRTEPPPVPFSEANDTQETPASSAIHSRARLVLFGIGLVMLCATPTFGPGALLLGVLLFFAAGIWHIFAVPSSTAILKQPIEIMPEWSDYSVDDARSAVLQAVAAENDWDAETEAAFLKYAQALAAAGLDRKAIVKKLAEAGLTYSGAIDICRRL